MLLSLLLSPAAAEGVEQASMQSAGLRMQASNRACARESTQRF